MRSGIHDGRSQGTRSSCDMAKVSRLGNSRVNDRVNRAGNLRIVDGGRQYEMQVAVGDGLAAIYENGAEEGIRASSNTRILELGDMYVVPCPGKGSCLTCNERKANP